MAAGHCAAVPVSRAGFTATKGSAQDARTPGQASGPRDANDLFRIFLQRSHEMKWEGTSFSCWFVIRHKCPDADVQDIEAGNGCKGCLHDTFGCCCVTQMDYHCWWTLFALYRRFRILYVVFPDLKSGNININAYSRWKR